jgi:hypothetical protein
MLEPWNQASSEEIPYIMPLEPCPNLQNAGLLTYHGISATSGIRELLGESSFNEGGVDALPDLAYIGSQGHNFRGVFDMNSFDGFEEYSSVYGSTPLLESGNDVAEPSPYQSVSGDALLASVRMSKASQEVCGNSKTGDIQLIDESHTSQLPRLSFTTDFPGTENSSPSTFSSSKSITTTPSEIAQHCVSNTLPSEQGIVEASLPTHTAFGPCRYSWTLPKRVSGKPILYNTLLILRAGS